MTELEMTTDYELLMEMRDIVLNTRLCRHENIISYHAVFVNDEKMWTVTDPVRGGSCKEIMQERHPDGLHIETAIATILREVLKALVYLHDNHFIHNNVRADSVMLDYNGDVKLSGMHQMIQTMSHGKWKRSVFKFVGDPEWMAPEVLSQATTFNEKVDIYSLGIFALELFYGRTPFDGWPALKILLCKLHYECPSMESNKVPSKIFMRFVERCLAKNPNRRPTAVELLEDPLMKQARHVNHLCTYLPKLKALKAHYKTAESAASSRPSTPSPKEITVFSDPSDNE